MRLHVAAFHARRLSHARLCAVPVLRQRVREAHTHVSTAGLRFLKLLQIATLATVDSAPAAGVCDRPVARATASGRVTDAATAGATRRLTRLPPPLPPLPPPALVCVYRHA